MFEIWLIQQVIISLIITVVLGGFLTAILWFALRKKLLFKDEMVVQNQLRRGMN
jgi:phosphate/sulfate permease